MRPSSSSVLWSQQNGCSSCWISVIDLCRLKYYWHWFDCSLISGSIKLSTLKIAFKCQQKCHYWKQFSPLIQWIWNCFLWEYCSTDSSYKFILIVYAPRYNFLTAIKFKYFTNAELTFAPSHWFFFFLIIFLMCRCRSEGVIKTQVWNVQGEKSGREWCQNVSCASELALFWGKRGLRAVGEHERH